MAFQTGTRIDPNLARADMSGFYQGSSAIGKGIAALGQGMAVGLQKYKMDKDKLKSIGGISKGFDTAIKGMQESGIEIPQELRAVQAYSSSAAELMQGDTLNRQEKLQFAEAFPAITQSMLSMYNKKPQEPVYADVSGLMKNIEAVGGKFDEKTQEVKDPSTGKYVPMLEWMGTYGKGWNPELHVAARSLVQPRVVEGEPSIGNTQRLNNPNFAEELRKVGSLSYTSGGFSYNY